LSETFSDDRNAGQKFAIIELLILVFLGKISQDFSKKTNKKACQNYGIMTEFDKNASKTNRKYRLCCQKD